MKTHLKASLASFLILCGGAAAAADLPHAPALPPAPALPAFYNWTGFYVGAQAGYSWGADTTKDLRTAGPIPRGATFDYHPSSALGGVHAGFNIQFGSVVLGIEGDVEYLNARGGFHDPSGVRSPSDPGRHLRVQQDWQGSVRGRIGYAFDRMMIYGTGGVAFTNFDYASYNPVAGLGETGTFSRTGWTVGGGANFAFTDQIVVGLDYRYTDYGKFDYVASSAFPGLTAEQKPSSHALRASVAYKF